MAFVPRFPPVPAYLPRVLNPLSFRHQLLLLYWVYCCPSHLRLYLYQLHPERYQSSTGLDILQTFQWPGYQPLYLCVPFSILLLGIGFSVPISLLWNGLATDWGQWLLGLGLGTLAGIVFGTVFGLTFGLSSNTVKGVAWGITIGLITGVANATGLAILLGAFPVNSLVHILDLESLGVVTIFSFAVGVPLSLMIGGYVGGIVGIIAGLSSGLICSFVFGIVQTAVDNVVANGIIYAAMVGLASMGTFGAARTMASCLMACFAVSVAVGLSVDYFALQQPSMLWSTGMAYGAIATVMVLLGSFRIVPIYLIYLAYLGLQKLSLLPWRRHPLEWDELLILPLPGTQSHLEQLMVKAPHRGVQLVLQRLQNPFQRASIQRSLKHYLSQHPTPQTALYHILKHPVSQSYLFPPIEPEDWQKLPACHKVLLAELSGQWTNATADPASHQFERLVYGLTWLGRNHDRDVLSGFYQMLYALVDDSTLSLKLLMLSRYVYADAGLVHRDMDHEPQLHRLVEERGKRTDPEPKIGLEFQSDTEDRQEEYLIQRSLQTLATFLNLHQLKEIAQVTQDHPAEPMLTSKLRQPVIQMIGQLWTVANEVAIASSSPSQLLRQGALLRANALLEEQENQVETLFYPEQVLLQTIIRRWSHLVTEAGKQAGQLLQSSQIIANPYVVGPPVTGKLFVGRQDILNRLIEALSPSSGACPSIVLYGHRRMGKSSILKNLQSQLKSDILRVVGFNMQVLGQVEQTGELLYALARQIARSLSPQEQARISVPEKAEFLRDNPYHTLDEFFQSLVTQFPQQRFIVAIDEFEKIEEKIQLGQLSQDLLEFLRGLTQTYTNLSLVFAGLHTLEEMCHSYWHPFFTSLSIPVSFLDWQAARALILHPAQVGYDDATVKQMIQLTSGQPYLLQLMGHTLINYLNRQQLGPTELVCLHEQGDGTPGNGAGGDRTVDRPGEPWVFKTDDLATILDSPEFYTAGSAYFRGIWLQAAQSSVPGQREILHQLASLGANVVSPTPGATKAAAQGVTLEQLLSHVQQTSQLTAEQCQAALKTLIRHDVVTCQQDHCGYQVELMRRWVVQQHNAGQLSIPGCAVE